MEPTGMVICGECKGHRFILVYGRKVTKKGNLSYDTICADCGHALKMTFYG